MTRKSDSRGGNPNLLEVMRRWRELGGEVKPVRKTGELDFLHPNVGRTRVNGRRKDCPMKLLTLLRRLEKSMDDPMCSAA